jgi:RNA polymerase sigma-70 factor (ECF subfamily)
MVNTRRRFHPDGRSPDGLLEAWTRTDRHAAGNPGFRTVALSEIDRNLLERCLQQKPRAWEDFVDRFMGLVVHVVNHSAQARSVRLSPEDRDDLCAEVFLNIIKDDFGVLRHFRGEASLATYLTVIARRIVVRSLLKRKAPTALGDGKGPKAAEAVADPGPEPEKRINDRDQIERLLGELDGQEAEIVRMYHLESKSYQEISSATGVSENTIGPILSRARGKMRRTGVEPAAG